MRFKQTSRTIAAGVIALGALLFTQAASPGDTPAGAPVRADGPHPVTVPVDQPVRHGHDRNDVTWGS
ncbi:hypothetical protein [Streptomyces sp. URMC 124]|uniref:hypothetical protein n=1 Tax=Streptomyces sp. URMC 124 TaxID=3423405 RepID=UPI003F195B45